MKLLVPFLAALLLLTACSSNDNNSSSTPSPTATATPAVTAASTSTEVASSPTATATAESTETPTPEPTATPPAVIDASNLADLQSVANVTVDTAQFMAWQEDGRLLVASRTEAVLIDDTGAEQTAYTATGNEGIVGVSKHGQIAVSSDNVTIDIHDLSGTVVSTVTTPAQFGSVDFSDDGTLLATSRLDQIAVDIWHTDSGALDQEVTGFQTAAPVYSATLSPDNSKLIWHARATIQIMDLATGDLGPRMEHEDFVGDVILKPDNSLLVTTWATTATLWNPQTGDRIKDLDQGDSAFAATLLPDSGQLLVGTDAGVNLWDPTTFDELASLDTPARSLAISADGTHLATRDQNGVINIWSPPAH